MQQEELIYLLALQQIKGIGDIIAKKLISYCGSAKAVFNEKKNHLSKIPGVGDVILKKFNESNLLTKATHELEYAKKNNIQVIGFLDANYPEKLVHCADAPIVLFQKGNIQIKQPKIISIVGTRNMTSRGLQFLEKLIEDIKIYNPIIVSGLAYGVDIAAHRLSLKNKLQTIAVLAHGLDRIYPVIHKNTARQMQENGGIMSDFWSKTNPDRENFIKRNRIIAGLSQATIVIESASKGGSLITADIANSYNRDVFAVPGRVTDQFSKGCNNLIKTNRANLLTEVADLAYILNWEKEPDNKQKTIQKTLFINLDEKEKKVYNYLLKEGKQQLDTIALNSKMPVQKTVSLLFNLELKGVIKPLPGKIYEAV